MHGLDQYPHEKLHAEFLTAIAESGLTEHGLGNYWSAELDVDPGAATSKVRRWKQAFPGPIVAFVCLMDLLGYRIKLEKKFEQVLPIRDLIIGDETISTCAEGKLSEPRTAGFKAGEPIIKL